MAGRNYSFDDVKKQISERLPDALKYIVPQKDYADLVIRFFDPDIPEQYDESYMVALHLDITMSISVDIEPILYALSKYGVQTDFEFTEDLEKQIIHITPRNKGQKEISFNWIAENIIPQLDDLTINNLNGKDDLSGIIKIMILYIISHKMTEEL